jgi:hypothetical protein
VKLGNKTRRAEEIPVAKAEEKLRNLQAKLQDQEEELLYAATHSIEKVQ